MSAAEQKEAFQNALSEALGDACNMELVQSIHDRLRDQIEQHKESHDPEPLELSVSDAAEILRDNGVEEEKILAFRDSCVTQFGDGATLIAAALKLRPPMRQFRSIRSIATWLRQGSLMAGSTCSFPQTRILKSMGLGFVSKASKRRPTTEE